MEDSDSPKQPEAGRDEPPAKEPAAVPATESARTASAQRPSGPPAEVAPTAEEEPKPAPKPPAGARRKSFFAEPPEETIAISPRLLARASRRDFLLFGAGAVAAAAGFWFLMPDPHAPAAPDAAHSRLARLPRGTDGGNTGTARAVPEPRLPDLRRRRGRGPLLPGSERSDLPEIPDHAAANQLQRPDSRARVPRAMVAARLGARLRPQRAIDDRRAPDTIPAPRADHPALLRGRVERGGLVGRPAFRRFPARLSARSRGALGEARRGVQSRLPGQSGSLLRLD